MSQYVILQITNQPVLGPGLLKHLTIDLRVPVSISLGAAHEQYFFMTQMPFCVKFSHLKYAKG